jgi:hypothetical protein
VGARDKFDRDRARSNFNEKIQRCGLSTFHHSAHRTATAVVAALERTDGPPCEGGRPSVEGRDVASSPDKFGRSLALAPLLLALSCGAEVTNVGAEFTRDSGAPAAGTTDGSNEVDATHCTGDLSNVLDGNFRVSFVLASTQTGLVALLNQRRECVPSVFWDVRMETGRIHVEVDDVSHYDAVVTVGATINDGRPHEVRMERASAMLTVFVDGANAGSVASQASLGALASLATGTDVCVTSTDGTVELAGQISSVCVAR